MSGFRPYRTIPTGLVGLRLDKQSLVHHLNHPCLAHYKQLALPNTPTLSPRHLHSLENPLPQSPSTIQLAIPRTMTHGAHHATFHSNSVLVRHQQQHIITIIVLNHAGSRTSISGTKVLGVDVLAFLLTELIGFLRIRRHLGREMRLWTQHNFAIVRHRPLQEGARYRDRRLYQ